MNLHITLVDHYFRLLKNLDDDSKLELIEKLSRSMMSDNSSHPSSISSLYGAWASDQSAEDELIADIRAARTRKE